MGPTETRSAPPSGPARAETGRPPARLDSLTGLRFVAALVVFGLHLQLLFPFAPYAVLTRVVGQGGAGVSFFFVLSGFVLTWSRRRSDTSGAFYRRRFARIYPLHVATWGAMVAVLALWSVAPHAGPAVVSLALLGPWVPSMHYAQAVNVPAWSLGCEAFFYAFFPFLHGPLTRLSAPRRRAALLAAMVAVFAVAALCAPAGYGTTKYWLLYFFPPTRLLEFVIGMGLAVELRHGRLPKVPLSGALGLAAGAYLAAGWAPSPYRPVAVTIVPFCLLVVAAAQRDRTGARSVLARRPLVALGSWSYAFYLVHFPLMTATALLLARHGVQLGVAGGVLLGLSMLAGSTALAAGLHRFVERPLERRLRHGARPTVAREGPWGPAAWLVGALGLGVRVGVVLVTHVRLLNDSADYQRLAVSLAHGHGFGTSHFAPGGGPTALRPPLYPLFVAGVYKAVGVHLSAARLAGAVLGALAVVLLVVVAWHLWGRTVGLVAGVLAAVFPPAVMASTALMSEALAVPLELAALLCVLSYRRAPHVGWALGSGGLLGLLVLARPSLAVLAVPILVLLYRRRPTWRQLGAAGLVVVAGAAVVTPWLVRDRIVMGSWVPVTTQSGYVLSGTYNATSAHDPHEPAAWRPANLDPAMDGVILGHPGAGELRTDALLQSAAVSYLRHHPTYVVTVVANNTLRLFDVAPLAEVRAATTSEYGYGAVAGTLEAGGGVLVVALALLGLCTRRGRRVPLAVVGAPVLLGAGTVFLQAVPRFRAVIDPFLLMLAAVTVVTVAGALRARWRPVPTLPTALGLPAVAPAPPTPAPTPVGS
ncbi:MAG: acyltransferase family protein [Acidobacteriota bacterium]|nr:acyltransferase family protein [Acidobacteriota bacterium]